MEAQDGMKLKQHLLPYGYTKRHHVCDFVGEEWKVIVGSTERQKNNLGMEGEKKVRLLFTCGKGKKRTYGKTTWNMERLDYFYTAEKN
jgi:hypothetical protein